MRDRPRSLWDRTGQLPPQQSAASATYSGLRGGGLAAHLHSSLCLPMISSQPCGCPWGRRLCRTLPVRKGRLTETDARHSGGPEAPVGQVECTPEGHFILSGQALKAPLIHPGQCGPVGWVSSHKPKCRRFDSRSGMPGLQVQSPRGVPLKDNPSIFPFHTHVLSLSFSLPPPLSRKSRSMSLGADEKQTNH